jgi:hypothetical protein
MPAALVSVFAIGIKLRRLDAAESSAALATAFLSSSFRESGRFRSEPRSFVPGGYARAACSGERSGEKESSEHGAAALG